ncbi:M50 family metallopeptidase [Actinotalea sp. M2MS4P-6]|uniref:M50 family metallopeptidase n=1 Tax=Actinotalea sp. M2MS4P-6 TaxID=2983762 RepID=UPI0021E4026D|nr:M50 family metallopeptidase [Actinotalea sp. M2MS4P-6]MCV2394814.1 M50 family metallopeptidase [Actinotalea sp. M2MS4P-6]
MSVSELWARATAASDPASLTVVLATAAAVLVVLATPRLWLLARHLLTIVHEGSHAGVALLTGRRLSGIRLHADTSGLTVSVGPARGPGMVATAFAGYVGPALAGLGAAWLLSRGHAAAVLWLLLVLVAVMLVAIRNLYGLWTLLVAGVVLGLVTWYLDPQPWAHAVAWFFLLGAPRAVIELARTRRRSRTSDADTLARLTHLPAWVWVGVFGAVCLAAAAVGAVLLVGAAA